jgi:hypothetical protein
VYGRHIKNIKIGCEQRIVAMERRDKNGNRKIP